MVAVIAGSFIMDVLLAKTQTSEERQADIVRQEYETKKGRSSKAASATSTSSDKKGKKKSK